MKKIDESFASTRDLFYEFYEPEDGKRDLYKEFEKCEKFEEICEMLKKYLEKTYLEKNFVLEVEETFNYLYSDYIITLECTISKPLINLEYGFWNIRRYYELKVVDFEKEG